MAGSIVISNLEIEGVNNATREPEFISLWRVLMVRVIKSGIHVKLLTKIKLFTSVGDIESQLIIYNQLAFIGAKLEKQISSNL